MLDRLAEAHSIMLTLPQVPLTTGHLFHGGMYARTIKLQAGVWMLGSLILRATILIVHGDCSVISGEQRLDLTGYNVLPGSAGRKQLFLTHGPVEMTMLFPTSTCSVEEVENEVFAEAGQLQSRKDDSRDTVVITGQ
jgi:hypothetical protein